MPRDYVLQPFQASTRLQIDYAGELNEQQHAAVTAPPGPALVIAGAGSGKTRTLTYRVAYLLEHGIPADRVLLLTFTNKAAKEMMRRVTDLLDTGRGELWGGTFHSVGARLLRRFADRLGYRPDFTILDRDDSVDLLKACLADANIDVKATRFPKAEALGEMFSLGVNKRISVAEIIGQMHPQFSSLTAQIEDISRRFTARKLAANVLDSDDLLVQWLKLLQDHPDARDWCQGKFQFILVDEYQDTNQLQGDLIDLMAAQHHNVMVVGDDSQSIYGWRGANFRNILEFPKRYPGAKVYKIEVNYRSTPEILSVANAAIAANQHQFAKQLSPARKPGVKPGVVKCFDASQQATFIAQRVLELREEGEKVTEMAVLYRSHFHALELQLELTRRNIPFTITSGIRFFEQAHIKDVAAYLKLVVNPTDELALKRIAQMLPGVGGKGAEKLWRSFAAALANPSLPSPTPVAAALQSCGGVVPKKTVQSWTDLTITVSQLEEPALRQKTSEMIRYVLEAGYSDYLEETFDNHRRRLEEIEQLGDFASQFPSVEEFLTQLSLLTNLEAEAEQPRAQDDERIRLSTIHQAKGLEWDVVFVIMLCDGLFPSARSLETQEGEEEERRLFYVAVTRARNELYLCHPLMRATAGQMGEMPQTPSRFLKEIPNDLTEEWNLIPSTGLGHDALPAWDEGAGPF